ncbi:hypothetical protein [Ruegeria sp. Alg231-54]|uniref:hypothetical protein n=1 Tax=Ruegeria sp. Alg231-54 TaxID=1922221 RepID=UPI000D556F10|nr:hypothetical protein [Ruegeria sp. Alg231-54]
MRPLLEQDTVDWTDEIFMEQEEKRSIRTRRWNFMRRLQPTYYGFGHTLNNLANDPDERVNVADDPEYASVVKELFARADQQRRTYSDPKWGLWIGRHRKSNST